MALWAAFLRFMTAAASVSGARIERFDLVFDGLEEEGKDDALGEASGEDGEEAEDDVDAFECFLGLVVAVFLVSLTVSTGDKLPLLVSLLCEGDHVSLSGSERGDASDKASSVLIAV